jgi:hypothetical protein
MTEQLFPRRGNEHPYFRSPAILGWPISPRPDIWFGPWHPSNTMFSSRIMNYGGTEQTETAPPQNSKFDDPAPRYRVRRRVHGYLLVLRCRSSSKRR